ncbi:MAG TPA: hypothetical protein VFG31_01120 [Conexibacter sp.]|nr:hypothetical protein [Conexibacter sp.]
MSALHPGPVEPGALLCPRCGSTLRGDQSWCLECGLAARTRIHPPPSWRIPIVLTCVLLALLAAGIAVALVTLLDTPESAPPPATVTVPATASTPTTPLATVPTPTPTVPPTSVPSATTPGTTLPGTTTPGATTPGVATPGATAPSAGSPRTFTIPGTRIRLPASAIR